MSSISSPRAIAVHWPSGPTGRGLAVVALLAVSSAALLARQLSVARVPPRIALLWLTAGVVAAAALVGVSSSGAAYLFAYFLVGHIGFRLPLKQAL